MEIKMKDVAPDGESLYDVLQKRIAKIHKEGRVDTRRNLLNLLQKTLVGLVYRLSALAFSGESCHRWDSPTAESGN